MLNTVRVASTDQMPNIHVIPLKGQVPGGAGIEILRAEMRLDIGSPLAVIRYAEQGIEPQYGLRLDIDKKVFIDHLMNEAQEHVLQLAAPKIAAMLSVELRTMRYMDFTKETMSSSSTATNNISNTNLNRNVNAQDLHEAHVTVDRPAEAITGNAIRENVVEVAKTSEIPDVSKEARVVEEVVGDRGSTQRTETVRDTVRRADVNVEQIAGQTTMTGTTVGRGVGYMAHDLADNAAGTVNRIDGSIPGIQTGRRAIDGSNAPDTRGITEKIADTVTGSRVDDKTGRPV